MLVDDVDVGQTGTKLRALGGDRRLKLTKPGFAAVMKTIQVRPPEPLQLDFTLLKGGTGPDGRFTAADLNLVMEPSPEPPKLLRETRYEGVRNVDGGDIGRGALWGA